MKSDQNWELIMQGGNRQWRKTTGLQGIKILPSKCLQEINIGKQNWEKQGRQWGGGQKGNNYLPSILCHLQLTWFYFILLILRDRLIIPSSPTRK